MLKIGEGFVFVEFFYLFLFSSIVLRWLVLIYWVYEFFFFVRFRLRFGFVVDVLVVERVGGFAEFAGGGVVVRLGVGVGVFS